MARISKEKKEQIRQEILAVAQTKFRDHGYDMVSTKDIAKDVGIAEGTLFNYFDSKMHLFLEVFASEFSLSQSLDPDVDLTQDLVDILLEHLKRSTKLILALPKGLLSELMVASIKMAKKHPKQFQKFVELDFRYMQDLSVLLERLMDANLIRRVDPQTLSELIYSAVAYEFLLYLYEGTTTKDTLIEQIRTKLAFLMDGYHIGGTHGH
jgi:AcrR family transcriptional regulator